MFAWLCRCRRRDLDIELDVPSPIPTSPTLPIVTAGTVLAEPNSEPPTLVSRRRNPRRTRVFVRMPSGEILPADVDLNWTIAQASDYIIANCSNAWLEGLGGTGDGYSLRFKRKILRKQTTLKDAWMRTVPRLAVFWGLCLQMTSQARSRRPLIPRMSSQSKSCNDCSFLRCGDALLAWPMRSCPVDSELALICLNNRAACYAQLKRHELVVQDTSEVLQKQPANMKALLRRMVALDALGREEAALKDAKDILILEPKNSHAMQVVARKRKSLTKKANDALPLSTGQPETTVAVFLFSEDRPLQCYACLRSLQKHLHGAALHVTVFWQAAERACVHSYQLLEALPELRSLQHGEIAWLEVSKGQLYSNFSRTVSRLSADGIRHLLLLSDAAVFHSSTDVAAASALLSERSETFAVRLDLNPRIEYFSEAELYASAPRSKPFANDPRLMVWTRSFDSSKMAYEAVPRESGWDDILCWTASLLRAEHVAHFFSALQGKQVDNVKELDDKAADWLSRRQRMKRREVSICTACFVEPLLITFDASGFGSAKEADGLLRAQLLHDLGGKVVQPVLPPQCWIVLAVLQWTLVSDRLM
ncbi:FKBPL [Symbiodinium sp. CCMP2456]|nr:FKBPL [Symbiodinium sp. CCMP2456]